VHKHTEGQLAVIGVLLSPGAANALIHKVWTYMPLDSGDKVNMPLGMLDLNELLPKDQRYYQFMGSLTTPPCSEQVLWMVLKQPMTLSPEQIRLFAQIFPNNARPVQPLHARLVRSAQ
jgi:carbonic anhydrase